MGRKIELSGEQVQWLRDNHEGLTFVDMAAEIGVCVDTLKRILVRLELRHFDAAKYVRPRSVTEQQPTWSRPCSGCGCTKPRAKWQFFCDPCHERQERGYFDD